MIDVDALIDGLAACQSLDDLFDACASLNIHRSRRFVHLELDIINRCNLRCVMCYHSLDAYRTAPTVAMTPEQFASLAQPLLPHAERLMLSMGAEPLMAPHFVDILRIGASHQVPDIGLFTNGLLLTDRIIGAILEAATHLCISVDGASRATYNSIRRDGDFDDLMRNVERFMARRRAFGRATTKVRFDFVMMQRNIHELPDLVRLAARLGVEQLSLRHVVSIEGLDADRESLRHTKALSNYWLQRGVDAAKAHGIEIQTRPEFFHLAVDDDSGAIAPKTAPAAGAVQGATPYCPFPFFHISMAPNGDVLACPYCHGEAPYGRVSPDTPVPAIWLNEKFQDLRRRILRRDPPMMCRRCPFLASRHPDIADLFATRSTVLE